MNITELVDLQDRLKTATADELADVVLNRLVVVWPPMEVLSVFGSDVVKSWDKALTRIGQFLSGFSPVGAAVGPPAVRPGVPAGQTAADQRYGGIIRSAAIRACRA